MKILIPLLILVAFVVSTSAIVITNKAGVSFRGVLLEILPNANQEPSAKIKRDGDGRIFSVPLNTLSEKTLIELLLEQSRTAKVAEKPTDPAWSQVPAIPSDWITVKAPRNTFEFKAPPDLKNVPGRGADSLVGKYESPSMILSYDYGWYSSPLADEKQPEYSSKLVKIDGKTAKVVTYEGVAAVHFPKVKDKNRLTVYVLLKKREAQATALQLFRTIRFK